MAYYQPIHKCINLQNKEVHYTLNINKPTAQKLQAQTIPMQLQNLAKSTHSA